MQRDIILGHTLREGRYELGWSAEQSAQFYGETLNGKPITRKAYLKMEEGYLPKDPKRRLVLAGMFSLAPTLFLSSDLLQRREEPIDFIPGVSKKAKALDLGEYRTSLLSYWKQGYRGTVDDALRDIARRIRALHDRVLYVRSDEKEQMKQLLWGFQLRFAHIAREQRYDKLALDHFNDAVILAHEENYVDFEVAALDGRGGFFFDLRNLNAALRDFKAGTAMKAPSMLKGDILALQGLTQMHLAQSDCDKTTALNLIDQAKSYVSPTFEDVLYQQSFPIERYFRLRARALMAAPVKKLRSPEKATAILDYQLNKLARPELKRLHVHHQIGITLVQTQIYRDQEYYPIATTTAQNALALMEEANSYFHLPALVSVYNDLKASSYGKDMEVAKLGVELMKAQHRGLFAYNWISSDSKEDRNCSLRRYFVGLH